MLTPDDIQKKIFTLGRKLENNDVGIFVKEMQINYQLIYDQANEQAKQITGMEKKLKYYRDVEGNLQDALVHAEKVSDVKIKEAEKQAAKIEEDAHKKAEDIIADAKSELAYLKSIIVEFEKSYDTYQDKYKDFILGQLKFIEDSKKFMDDEKITVKRFVSNIDIEPSVSRKQDKDEDELDFSEKISEKNSNIEDKEETSTTFKMPQFEMPKVEVPKVEVPQVDTAKTELEKEKLFEEKLSKDEVVKEEVKEEVKQEVKEENVPIKEEILKETVKEEIIDGDKAVSDTEDMVDVSTPTDNVAVEEIEDDAPEFSLSDVDNGVAVKDIVTEEKIEEKTEDKSNVDIPVKEDKVENIEVQPKSPKKELFSFASIMNKGNKEKDTTFDLPKPEPKPEPIIDIPDNKSELKKEIKLDGSISDDDLNNDAMVNSDDLFDLPEIDVDDLDFSNLNFSSSLEDDNKDESTTGVDFNAMNTPPSSGVDFNAMNTPPSSGVDFNAMNTPPSSGVDFNAMNTPPSPGVDFNAMNTPPSPGVDFNAMNTPPSSGVDFNAMNTPPSSGVDFNTMDIPAVPGMDGDNDNREPDLSLNSNIELTFANQSMFSKKKTDEKEKLLASLNISSNKDDEKARIKQLESSYAKDLLSSNQQLANQGGVIEPAEKPQRGYGPADYVSENNGFASKPLNPGANQPERKSLF